MSELLAADSFTVRNGRVRGLSLHLERFRRACLAQGHEVEPAQLRALLRTDPPIAGSPRLELTAEGVGLRHRPARPETDTATLAPVGVPDIRSWPKIKGPDIPVLQSLLSEVPEDELLLLDEEGTVVECCFSTPIRFIPGSMVEDVPWIAEFPLHPQQLESVTAQLVRRALLWVGVAVIEAAPLAPEQLQEGHVWLLNATHIRRVLSPAQAPDFWPPELLELQQLVTEWLDTRAEAVHPLVR
ncbi:aminotransferase class IV [Corynebacterium sp. A21]|uniref:aminotransferase class IV n=1 Tax=Corynebacterium sp. A21 TaxID=3457318 RepID=UPI003FD57053